MDFQSDLIRAPVFLLIIRTRCRTSLCRGIISPSTQKGRPRMEQDCSLCAPAMVLSGAGAAPARLSYSQVSVGPIAAPLLHHAKDSGRLVAL